MNDLIPLEQQALVALRLLQHAAGRVQAAAAHLTHDDLPTTPQVADLDDLMSDVRRRYTAWDRAHTQLGEQRRDDRRQT